MYKIVQQSTTLNTIPHICTNPYNSSHNYIHFHKTLQNLRNLIILYNTSVFFWKNLNLTKQYTLFTTLHTTSHNFAKHQKSFTKLYTLNQQYLHNYTTTLQTVFTTLYKLVQHLHTCTQFYTTLQTLHNCTQLCKTWHNFTNITTLLQQIITCYNTLQHSNNTLQHFTHLYNTLHNSTTHYITLQHSTNSSNLFKKLFTSSQNFT